MVLRTVLTSSKCTIVVVLVTIIYFFFIRAKANHTLIHVHVNVVKLGILVPLS